MCESSVVAIRAWTAAICEVAGTEMLASPIGLQSLSIFESRSFTDFSYLKSTFPWVNKMIMCFSHIDYIKFGLRLRQFNFKLLEKKFQEDKKTRQDQWENIMELSPELTDFQLGDDTARKEGTWSG